MPKMHPATWAALTVVPAMIVGSVLWVIADFVPDCENVIHSTLPSPSNAVDLVTFSRNCPATTGPNTQAALIVHGQTLPDDATGFLSISGEHDLAARWDAYGNLELTIPPQAEVYRKTEQVDDVAVIYQ